MERIDKILKYSRLQRKLTLEAIAAATGIHTTLLSRFESGSRIPTKSQLDAFVKLFELDAKKTQIVWLRDRIVADYASEDYFKEALILAESNVPYGNQVTSTTKIDFSVIDDLKHQLDAKRPVSVAQHEKLLSFYKIEYTFESNRIEGNTLTLQETSLVVEQGLTIGGKSMREHMEAINHTEAIDYVYDVVKQNEPLNARTLKCIHQLILRGIDKENAGTYRKVQVRIGGSSYIPPEPYMLVPLMERMFEFYEDHKNTIHPVELAAEMHEQLVTIHPFVDGNGHTARLLMNLILLQFGYPITNIKGDYTNRMAYYTSLHKAQVDKDKRPFIQFVADAVVASLKEYIKMLN